LIVSDQRTTQPISLVYVGSTGVVAVIESKTGRCNIGNLGDSEVIVVHFNKEGSLKYAKTLNRLHNVTEVRGLERLKDAGYPPLENNRIAGRLELTRSFGDMKYQDYGLSDDPELILFKPELEEGDELYYIISSDGIRYKDRLSKKQPLSNEGIAQLIQENRKLPLDQLAFSLTREAKDKRSANDNISILISKIPLIPDTNELSLFAVFDGHGGSSVSQVLNISFM
jgi:serine/threonine protein phosphatase PrpC